FLRGWRASRGSGAARAWNGRSWTGTRAPSGFTGRWAPGRWRTGSSTDCPERRWRRSRRKTPSRRIVDRRRKSLPAALLAVALALAAAPPSWPGARPKKLDSLGQEIVALVRDKFYDPAAARSWAAAHDHYGARAEDQEAFVRITREALEE